MQASSVSSVEARNEDECSGKKGHREEAGEHCTQHGD